VWCDCGLPRKAEDFNVYTLSDPRPARHGQFPPALDDKTQAKVLFWLRAFRRDKTVSKRFFSWVPNAAEVRQTKRARPEFLGTGNAQADQSYPLVNKRWWQRVGVSGRGRRLERPGRRSMLFMPATRMTVTTC